MTERSGGGDINVSLALLWQMDRKPRRGRKAQITLDQIVDAAVAVADAEGLDAVSMRRVAADLEVGTMSLYRHVPGKSELLDLMLDKVSDRLDNDSLAGLGWRDHLERCARGAFDLYLQHRWLLQVDQSRPLLGPNALAGFEQYMRGMQALPLTDREQVMVISAVDAFVTGLARMHVNSLTAPERTGLTDEEFWAAQVPVLEKAMATGNFPTLAGLDADAFSGSWEETFDLGLRAILDGLHEWIQQRTHG
jgi:AcrR family transcriptional regulator